MQPVSEYFDPALPAPLREALAQALKAPPQRVQRVSGGGEALWLKRTEDSLSLWWRILKGNSRRAFEADRLALKDLARQQLPVPAIRAEGPDFFATTEIGTPVAHLLRGAQNAEELAPALEAAGRALGAFHAAGVVHGRPKLRDICWDGDQARLIDFERYRRDNSSPKLMAQDMLVLLHSLFSLRLEGDAEARLALKGWLSVAPEGMAEALVKRAKALAWLRPASRLALMRRAGSSEMIAMPVTLDWILATLR
ncbi:BUD32 family EKC/KEOPS complex subunit [Falsigemmobacter faecalis]|uniref:Serine/threonine protein phosphatase n=1 Tax=Falsigemmobacter faecalis TaxID=2488730 RepID=A0A3P3DWX3_9RHOB|nr:hypothetical protein [Falsigemmobacter faecalis]RRH78494.1 hypothetical protein EG244_00630 [Falsigemmobacter faecalis]